MDARQGLSTSTVSADLAAAQATIGSVSAATNAPTGAVTVGTNGGKGESTLLASRAVNLAADTIARQIESDVAGKTIVLMSGLDSPQFANHQQFEIRQDIVVRILQKATDTAASAIRQGDALAPGGGPRSGGPDTEAVPFIAGAGVALDALNKLGGYFRSEFSISNIDIAGDSAQLVAATGGKLLSLQRKPAVVIAPSVAVQNVSELKGLLKSLLDTMQLAMEANARLDSKAKAARAAAEAETDAAQKAKWTKAAVAYESALPILAQAQTKADDFLGTLSTTDSSGTMLLTKILRGIMHARGR